MQHTDIVGLAALVSREDWLAARKDLLRKEKESDTFPWFSSDGTDFDYDFHATLDDRVAPVLPHFRTETELAESGTPWTGGP